MTSDETEKVGVGEADEAEGAEMAEVAEVAVDEDELAELEDDFDWVAGFDEAEDVDEDDALMEDDEDDEDDGIEDLDLGLEDDEDVEEVEALEDLDEVEALEDLEVTEETEESEETSETEDDALMEDDESGWLADPDVEGQERFWDGSEWTDQVRPAEEEPDLQGRRHLPDHVPELQRALAAATADIDDVEARLSTLFERGEGKSGRGASTPSAGPPIHEEFGGSGAGDRSSHDRDHPISTGGVGTGGVSGDDEETFAELDAALAAEAPEKPGRRFFKRRS